MSISRVAFRNLSRNRVKTTLSIVAIVVGVAFYIYSECSNKGSRTAGFLNLINYESGAVQIYKDSYFPLRDELPLYESIVNSKEIEKNLDKHYYTAPRVRFSASIISPTKEIPFQIVGVNPEKEERVFSYPEDITPRNIKSGFNEIVLGYRGARELGVDVGDPVRVVADIEFKEGDRVKRITQLLDFTVVGLIKSDNVTLSRYSAIVPIDILRDENGMMIGESVTEIVVRDKEYNSSYLPTIKESSQVVSTYLSKGLREDLAIKDWTEYDINQMKTLSRNELAPVFFFMTLLIILLMSNTMLLSVMDRTREISLLRALGMDSIHIFKLLATEAALLGIIGGIIGIFVGFLITYNSVNTGFELNIELIEARNLDITISGNIKSAWSSKGFIVGGIGALITSVLAAAIPTLSALKMNIIKGIKNE